ncbi:MAG: hypothetical protein C5B43_01025 [Verrucomicrobia bacterium]|nr:MAG: hypothetical protein C5B43_01025 [Verrucomicrobiota bacterium]
MLTKEIKRYKPQLKIRSSKKSTLLNLASAQKLVENGLTPKFFDQLAHDLNINIKTFCDIVSITTRTFNRRKLEKKFNREESDRIMRIYLLFQFAKEVLGSKEEASSWLKTPKLALNEKTPLDLAKTEIGSREVEALLGQIQHGIFS